jgi:hypothetical protein
VYAGGHFREFRKFAIDATRILSQLLTSALAAVDIDPACITAGFTPSLTCTSCEDLSRFKLDGLYAQCTACCRRDEAIVKVRWYLGEPVSTTASEISIRKSRSV